MKIPRLTAFHFSALLVSLLISATTLSAQTAVSFSSVTSTAGETPDNIYSVDVNNDGLADIVQDSGQSPSGFTVSINKGDGTFKAPVTYTLPGNQNTPMPITTGDFNNDGVVDIAVALEGTNQIAIYLGNGDGTFQAPQISTIALPAGSIFGDGNIDLVAYTNASTDYTARSGL